MNTTDWGLVGDIGATYARFALVEPDGTLTKMRAIPCSDYATVGDVLAAYLGEMEGAKLAQAVLAVAASPIGDNGLTHQQPVDILYRRVAATRRDTPAARRQ